LWERACSRSRHCCVPARPCHRLSRAGSLPQKK
jgi:hypothetical protein